MSRARVRQRADREVHRAGLGFDGTDRAARDRALGPVGLRDHLLVLGVHEHRTREMRGFRKRDRQLSRRHAVATVVAECDSARLDALADVDQFLAVETAGERGDLKDRDTGRLLAASRASATRSGVSIGGVVFAIATTCVNPPAAAARAPVSQRLRLVVAGLTKVRVQVDEPRAEHARLHAVGGREVDHRHTRRVDVVVDGQDLPAVDPDVLPGGVETAERVDDPHAPQDRVHGRVLRRSHAPSTPSTSRRRTKTRSPDAVGTFLPT